MTDRDPHPDSELEADNDRRSDIEQAVQARADDVERFGASDDDTALEPSGVEDGVAGTGGVTKNQDDRAR